MLLVGYCCNALVLLLLVPASAFRPYGPTTASCRPARTKMQAAASDGGEDPLLSPILGQVATSKTIEIHALTKAMEARGEEVVSLCVGEPDFPPPPGVYENRRGVCLSVGVDCVVSVDRWIVVCGII